MISSALYKQPELLDSKLHATKKLRPLDDLSVTGGMHAVIVTVAEFPHAALEYPLIFVKSAPEEEGGAPVVSPVAMLGLSAGENLYLDGKRWNARYLPAFIRRYPFLTAPIPDTDRAGVFVDVAWPGFNDAEGEALFAGEGESTPALQRALGFLQQFEDEAQRTRVFSARLAELDVLKEMQAEIGLPDGSKFTVDGFWVVDEEKLAALPDATVMELHRNGMLLLLHAHLVSLANLQHLVNRKAARSAN